jgi:predicted DNA-binding transcriptional regulator YafY
MPANRNALIRYKTIDNCLKNRYRKWTLDDLVEKCSDALYEFEGIEKGISRRTVQMDIQIMRSEKLGYNAPIVVYDNKYYKYEDPDYSITNIPLNDNDLQIMSDAVELLKQFKNFSYFAEMSEIVNRLEDLVTSTRRKTRPVIDFEKNENLKGLEFLDAVYRAIIDKQTLDIKYCSFKAHSPQRITFYPYLLKEYRNRWFVFGMNKHNQNLYNLALDRILFIKKLENESFIENTLFNPETFFDDLVGVTKQLSSKPETVRFWADTAETPYIRTKPFHRSQKIVQQNDDGSAVFEIEVVINFELERDLFAYCEGICVLAPQRLAEKMCDKLQKAMTNYIRYEQTKW